MIMSIEYRGLAASNMVLPWNISSNGPKNWRNSCNKKSQIYLGMEVKRDYVLSKNNGFLVMCNSILTKCNIIHIFNQ
jgi:hypothetical protein